MATRTTATKRPASGRFSRPGGPSTQRPAGRRPSSAAPRRPSIVPRRRPQKSGIAKLVEGVSGALPGAGAKKSGAGGGGKRRTAGLAVLAGAAGLAFKNRDKMQGMLRGKGSDTGDRSAHADAPANPVVITEAPAASDAVAPPGDAAGVTHPAPGPRTVGPPESPTRPDATPPPRPTT
jgi:hypothetical protein